MTIDHAVSLIVALISGATCYAWGRSDGMVNGIEWSLKRMKQLDEQYLEHRKLE